jgi:hypothetical protein
MVKHCTLVEKVIITQLVVKYVILLNWQFEYSVLNSTATCPMVNQFNNNAKFT